MTLTGRPAAIGGAPALTQAVPFVKPPVPALSAVSKRLAPSYDRGILTNGPLVRELEEVTAERLGTAQVIAVSSCTSALMLVLRAFAVQGSVIVPSFTFCATAQAASWNGLDPIFVDCDPSSLQVAIPSVEAEVGPASALVATHIFGAPGPVDALEATADAHGVPLLFDAAHGFGATHDGKPIGGFGTAEVFSLSPTKPLVAGEGGLVSTNDDALASAVRDGRNYGDSGDYDPRLLGLNARMSELHAALALEGLAQFDESLARRRQVAQWYITALESVPGVACQRVTQGDESTYKDFGILIDPEEFGTSRDAIWAALKADGVETRRYFSPPVHRQRYYHDRYPSDLPVTDAVASRVLNLPIYPSLDEDATTVI
ncbi:MAG TPA: DegT/DnrJ/EryC1/StrS family aminotransferase, partial [Acidimicrobiales bacterium]